MLSKAQAQLILRRALDRGADAGQSYEMRIYQSTAAWKCASALVNGRHAVLTLPTGTGKTLICGMVASLFLKERPQHKVIFTAPRRTLINQLADRSAWLNPTCATGLVGADPREDDRHLRAAFYRKSVIFGMPEFVARRILSTAVPAELVALTRLLIIDEFDAFLTVRYLARGVKVDFHDALSALIAQLPDTCRLLLVSATTPDAATTDMAADPEAEVNATTQTAFREYLDNAFDPVFTTIAERYYRDFIPHAEILAVAVLDPNVSAFDQAISDEFGLLVNWISGNLGFPTHPGYVLPRIDKIIAGRLPIAPGRPHFHAGRDDMVLRLLGRLLLISHISDFLYEDMFEGFDREFVETFRFGDDFVARIPVDAWRLREPSRPQKKGKHQIAMHAELRGKFSALNLILARHRDKKGVLFFRNIRILNAVNRQLNQRGFRTLVVHGQRVGRENNLSITRFRAERDVLLLITRDTGKRGLDLPEADFAVFYSPKSRDDVTWQEVSRIRSTIRGKKTTYILYYLATSEEQKMASMIDALSRTTHSKAIRYCGIDEL